MQLAGTCGNRWVTIKEYVALRPDKLDQATVGRWAKRGYDGEGQPFYACKEGKPWYVWLGNRPMELLEQASRFLHPMLRLYNVGVGSAGTFFLDIPSNVGPGSFSAPRLRLLGGPGSLTL